jgi:hypothetical protein
MAFEAIADMRRDLPLVATGPKATVRRNKTRAAVAAKRQALSRILKGSLNRFLSAPVS